MSIGRFLGWFLASSAAALALFVPVSWLFTRPGNAELLVRGEALPEGASVAAAPRLAPVESPTASAGVPSVTPSPRKAAMQAALSGPERLRSTRNVVLLGLDRRPDAKGAGLTDSIVIAVLDEQSGHAGLVSVPRDLWVTIPGHGEDRLNVILAVAARQKVDGLELFKRVLGDTLAFPIEHALVLDLAVFERVVDAVGGVDLDVPCAIIDSFVDSRVEGGRRRLDVPAGPSHLDGVTAAMYVRSRHGRSDFSRARRQQAVLLGVRDRVLESGELGAIPRLYTAFERSIRTDLRRIDLLSLAEDALSLDRSRLHGLVLAPPLTEARRTEDGKSVLIPKPDAITPALDALLRAPLPGTPPRSECPPADAALRGRERAAE